MTSADHWLPPDWEHPNRVDLPTGHHLRPIGASDVDLDYPAVMASRARLWSIYGTAWGWPPASMTIEQDREDLAHHEDEIEQHRSFNYALFDPPETELLGCVYIDPPRRLAPMPRSRGGSWTPWWAGQSKPASTRSCRPGSLIPGHSPESGT